MDLQTAIVTEKALNAVRILAREPQGCECVFSDNVHFQLNHYKLKGIECLQKHAMIHQRSGAFVESGVTIEALKCLANVLLLKRDLNDTVIRNGSVVKLVNVNFWN